MIKLNNKNITYVALADSSNSLKAPKEIWYADSSKSVKLVYRRKDALIEGEDYEKYHWLKSTGAPCIDTLIYPTIGDFLRAEARQQDAYPTVRNVRFIISKGDDESIYLQAIGSATSIEFYSRQGNTESQIKLTDNFPLTIDIDMSMNVMGSNTAYTLLFNGEQYQSVSSLSSLQGYETYKILGSGNNGYLGLGNCRLKRITINSHIFIPCKLLKPVPKWLDANGIRRHAGECGMIDLISGKFYGNVNSVGTFTVENYYERKEWLQGRNGAYIDTMHPLTAIDDAMIVHAHYDGVTRNPSGYEQAICGVVEDKNDANKLWAYIYIGTDNNLNTYQRGVYRYSTYGLQTDAVNSLEFTASISNDGNNFTFTKNSNSITVNNPITRKTYGNVYLFNRNTMAQPELVSQRYFQGDIASFQIGNSTFTELSVDMIPCTLTMDLPASMDANNIARTKGTSGMWDLVSDRFYGNVANSGTFKAVNLAEGVDYEVHQWLKGDGTAYINTKVKLHFATDSIYIKGRKNGVATNESRLFGNYRGGTIPKSLELIYNTSVHSDTVSKQSTSDGRFRINPSSEFEFYTTPFSSTTSVSIIYNDVTTIFNVNLNEEYLEYEASDDLILLNTNDPRYCMKADVANFKVMRSSTIMQNLIPCKLLRPIPSKYDANGIARQAGECGMYDTVNDIFYGNVASSGTFSVEDDE